MPYEFYLPTKLLYGAGCLSALGGCALPGRKALLVTSAGQSAKRHGYLGRVEEQLTQAGVRAVLYDQITPNPTKAEVMAGAALCRKEGCDFVLGLGGGSSIDAAKAISVMARNPGDYWDYVSGGTGKGKAVPNAPLPVVAVTTTAGTGTEAIYRPNCCMGRAACLRSGAVHCPAGRLCSSHPLANPPKGTAISAEWKSSLPKQECVLSSMTRSRQTRPRQK